MPTTHQNPAHARLARLLDLHASDPSNTGLLNEAAESAYDAHDYDTCETLLGRLASLQPLSDAQQNLRVLSAMALGRFAEASNIFEALSASTHDATVVFNLAYAKAMQGDYASTVTMLDDDVLAKAPHAIPLKMQTLHHLARLDEAIELGKREAEHPMVSSEVCGLLAMLLLDNGDMASSRHYADKSGDTAVGHTIAGLLALDDADDDAALLNFEQALALQPRSGRAHLGHGLALLTKQHYARAAESLHHAAQLLATHAGTWVAAGWAYLLNRDTEQARACFVQARTLEPGFSESTGGLAMVAIQEGDYAQARHLTDVALRLDHESLSGGAAQSVLLMQAGDQQAATAAWHAVLERPLGPEAKTVAETLARRSLKSGISLHN